MTKKLLRTILLATTIASAFLLHSSAANANATFTYGGSQTASNTASFACPFNAVLVGFRSHTGVYVDGLKPECITVTSTGHWTGNAFEAGNPIGNMGAASDQHFTWCPTDQAVVKISGKVGWWIDSMTITCEPLHSPATTDGTRVTNLYVGGGSSGTSAQGECPGQPIISVKGTFGSYVNRLTLTCAALPV